MAKKKRAKRREKIFNTQQLALRLNRSVGTIKNWRCYRMGPKFDTYLEGRHYISYYKLSEVKKFEAYLDKTGQIPKIAVL